MSWLPDWLTGYDAANAAAANAKQQELADRAAAAAVAGDTGLANYYSGGLNGWANPDADRAAIDAEFGQALKDNASAMSSGLNSGLTFALKKILGAVPWWFWIVAAVALFIWMGGLALLKGRLAK